MLKAPQYSSKIEMGSVCFLNYDLGFGGTEKVIVSLANYFSSLGRKVTIVTLSNRNDFAEFIQPEIEIVCLNINKIKFMPHKLIHFVIKNKFDNFISNVWPLTSLSFVVRLFSPKTRLIFIEHCNLSEQFQSRSKLFKFVQKISILFFYKFAHLIIGVSKGVKEDLEIKGVHKHKIQVIHNPVISKPMQEIDMSNLVIKPWMLSRNKKLIAVGEFKAQKNFKNLVDAIYFAKFSLDLDLDLLILGDGDEKAYIAKKIINMGLDKNIFLAGWVDDPLPYFDLADLFVLPSNYEGFGVVIVEAMSRGLNIVSTNCKSGPNEILLDGALGTLCEVNDHEALANAILHGLSHPIEADKLIKRSEDFSEKKIGKLYEDILV
jgi:glycosyltransferase involved in cell wall biosynthesis